MDCWEESTIPSSCTISFHASTMLTSIALANRLLQKLNQSPYHTIHEISGQEIVVDIIAMARHSAWLCHGGIECRQVAIPPLS